MTNKTVLPSRPVTSSETVLRDKFAESIVGQSELMDRLAQQLITLELAIPGLYATALKLLSGDAATVALDTRVYPGDRHGGSGSQSTRGDSGLSGYSRRATQPGMTITGGQQPEGNQGIEKLAAQLRRIAGCGQEQNRAGNHRQLTPG